MVIVPEKRELFGTMSVEDNLLLGAFTQRRRGRMQASLADVYRRFPKLESRRAQLAATLSGGERQMLAIGAALAVGPELLLVDELSQGLAPLVVEELIGRVRQIRDDLGITVLLVEQNAQVALEIADHGYIMENGRIVLDGPPARLTEHQDVREFYLGGGAERRSYRDVKQYRRSRRWYG